MFIENLWFWVIFNLCILVLLIVDLTLFHRKEKSLTVKEALGMNAFWVLLAMLFMVWIYFWRGHEDALNFLTGYLVEYSLSIDNLFVFILIFTYFQVPSAYVYKVLFWGILGAIVMRGLFILGGVVIVEHFHWVFYLFGVFLIATGIKLAMEKDTKVNLEHNFILKIFRYFFPLTEKFHGNRFFVKIKAQYFATPLFVVLLAIESTDIIFAMDSIPAIMGITLDPFIIYTSNIFAILGLRSLHFALDQLFYLFHYLHYGLAAILIFIGTKMVTEKLIVVPLAVTFAFVVGALSISIAASYLDPKK